MSDQQSLGYQQTGADDVPTTRRAVRLRRENGRARGEEPQLPVTIRPPWTAVGLLLVVCVTQPGRRGSLLLAGLAEGPTSKKALLSYGLAFVGVLVTALFARTHVALRVADGGQMVLIHQGLLRRRVLSLDAGHQVKVVAGPARRVIILDAEGRLALVLGAFAQLWRRDDVVALLKREGVAVGHEHGLNRASEIEAAFPGSTAWIERSKARLYGVVGAGTIVFVFLLAWYLEF
jgi:hypothetical protein